MRRSKLIQRITALEAELSKMDEADTDRRQRMDLALKERVDLLQSSGVEPPRFPRKNMTLEEKVQFLKSEES